MSKALSQSEVKSRVFNVHGDTISVIGNYTGFNKPVDLKCRLCNISWATTLTHLVAHKTGCPNCNRSGKPSLSVNKVLAKIKTIHGNNISLIDTYTRSDVPVNFRCNVCSNKWKTTYAHVVYHKTGCPKCSKLTMGNSKIIDKSIILTKIRKTHGNSISLIGNYTKATAKTKFKCKEGHIWQSTAANIAEGSGCPKCARMKHSIFKTIDEAAALTRIKDAHNDTIIMCDPYQTMSTMSKFKCVTCNNEWKSTPFKVADKKSGCTVCSFHKRPGFKRKSITISGKTFVLQGHEPLALKQLLAEGHEAKNIKFGRKIPFILYISADAKLRRYYPDLYTVKDNTLIEVKSVYTMLIDPDRFEVLKLKRMACIKQGYKFKLMVFGGYGEPIRVPKAWYNLSYKLALILFKGLNITKRL